MMIKDGCRERLRERERERERESKLSLFFLSFYKYFYSLNILFNYLTIFREKCHITTSSNFFPFFSMITYVCNYIFPFRELRSWNEMEREESNAKKTLPLKQYIWKCVYTSMDYLVNIYIYIYIYVSDKLSNTFSFISSSSSCRAGSRDIPHHLLPLLPIVHRPRQVFRTTSRILT